MPAGLHFTGVTLSVVSNQATGGNGNNRGHRRNRDRRQGGDTQGVLFGYGGTGYGGAAATAATVGVRLGGGGYNCAEQHSPDRTQARREEADRSRPGPRIPSPTTRRPAAWGAPVEVEEGRWGLGWLGPRRNRHGWHKRHKRQYGPRYRRRSRPSSPAAPPPSTTRLSPETTPPRVTTTCRAPFRRSLSTTMHGQKVVWIDERRTREPPLGPGEGIRRFAARTIPYGSR